MNYTEQNVLDLAEILHGSEDGSIRFQLTHNTNQYESCGETYFNIYIDSYYLHCLNEVVTWDFCAHICMAEYMDSYQDALNALHGNLICWSEFHIEELEREKQDRLNRLAKAKIPNNVSSTEKYYTDYSFVELGDTPNQEAPIREVSIVKYDGNKYCDILVEGRSFNIKMGYIYPERRRFDPKFYWSDKHLGRFEKGIVS